MPVPYPNEEAGNAGNAGVLPPDSTLILKTGHGGDDCIFFLLTGYVDAPEFMNYNPYFPGSAETHHNYHKQRYNASLSSRSASASQSVSSTNSPDGSLPEIRCPVPDSLRQSPLPSLRRHMSPTKPSSPPALFPHSALGQSHRGLDSRPVAATPLQRVDDGKGKRREAAVVVSGTSGIGLPNSYAPPSASITDHLFLSAPERIREAQQLRDDLMHEFSIQPLVPHTLEMLGDTATGYEGYNMEIIVECTSFTSVSEFPLPWLEFCAEDAPPQPVSITIIVPAMLCPTFKEDSDVLDILDEFDIDGKMIASNEPIGKSRRNAVCDASYDSTSQVQQVPQPTRTTYSTWANIPIDPALQAQPAPGATPITPTATQDGQTTPAPVYQYTPYGYYQSYQNRFSSVPGVGTSATGATTPTPVVAHNNSTYTPAPANGIDTSDINTLKDASGSTGVDLRAEEESLQRTSDSHLTHRSYEDRREREEEIMIRRERKERADMAAAQAAALAAQSASAMNGGAGGSGGGDDDLHGLGGGGGGKKKIE
ncbi:MAG: hypothetical protein NXY57DRAFT_1090614 [Lentinula lateritia]|nr:MAG: hypothetical protein NXY57DRAFT_1090614 [Lentinula lateritia]